MSRDKYTGDGFTVRVMERPKARRLITIGTEHPYWQLPPGVYALAEEVTNAIVRVQPPPGATEEQVHLLQEALVKGQCARIRQQPWSRVKDGPVQAKPALRERTTVRALVMTMAAESKQAERLVPLLDAVLTGVNQ
jgi:hypothetical protein